MSDSVKQYTINDIIKVDGDGNCLFHALLVGLNKLELNKEQLEIVAGGTIINPVSTYYYYLNHSSVGSFVRSFLTDAGF